MIDIFERNDCQFFGRHVLNETEKLTFSENTTGELHIVKITYSDNVNATVDAEFYCDDATCKYQIFEMEIGEFREKIESILDDYRYK
tara:strand:+ start:358 stop:618 length:261 start_codon:yes stop_codon:yes gene_type:complete